MTVLSNAQLLQLSSQYFGADKAPLMAAIAKAESGGNAGIRNLNPSTGDDSRGLWQVNMLGSLGPARLKQYGLSDASQLNDPNVNARVASSILKSQGLGAWGAYTNGSYKQFLPQMQAAAGQPAAPIPSGISQPQPQSADSATVQPPTPQPQTDPISFANSYAARIGSVMQAMAAPRDYGGLSGNIDITPLSVKLDQQNQANATPNAILSALMSASGGRYV